MCHSTGLPPISIIGLGLVSVSSLSLEPSPPAKITAFTIRTSIRYELNIIFEKLNFRFLVLLVASYKKDQVLSIYAINVELCLRCMALSAGSPCLNFMYPRG